MVYSTKILCSETIYIFVQMFFFKKRQKIINTPSGKWQRVKDSIPYKTISKIMYSVFTTFVRHIYKLMSCLFTEKLNCNFSYASTLSPVWTGLTDYTRKLGEFHWNPQCASEFLSVCIDQAELHREIQLACGRSGEHLGLQIPTVIRPNQHWQLWKMTAVENT